MALEMVPCLWLTSMAIWEIFWDYLSSPLTSFLFFSELEANADCPLS